MTIEMKIEDSIPLPAVLPKEITNAILEMKEGQSIVISGIWRSAANSYAHRNKIKIACRRIKGTANVRVWKG